jgi:hypothetical protein
MRQSAGSSFLDPARHIGAVDKEGRRTDRKGCFGRRRSLLSLAAIGRTGYFGEGIFAVAHEKEKQDLQAVRADLAALAAKIDHISNDIAKGNLTAGELEAADEDLKRLKLEIDGLVTRVDQLEGREKNR